MLLFFVMVSTNKNAVNDNTSGVLTILNIANKIKDTEIKNHVKFVFFDNEHIFFKKKYTNYWKALNEKDIKILNFNRVSNGKVFLLSKNADERLNKELENYIILEGSYGKHFKHSTIDISKGFVKDNGHTITIDDKYLDLENIEKLSESILSYVKQI